MTPFQRARALTKKVLRSVRLPEQADAIQRFNYIYYHGTAGQTPTPLTWFGVEILKCPQDLLVYQEILHRTKPDVILECGVRFGGSGLYLAHLCDLLGHGEILGVDITLRNVHEKTRAHPRIRLLEGSSTDPSIVGEVKRHCAGRKTMVVLDSDHSEAHVTNELSAYAELVTPGCYLVVEDTNVNGHPVFRDHGPGPYEAVQNFLRKNDAFRVDTECERFLLTYNPSGYLLRI